MNPPIRGRPYRLRFPSLGRWRFVFGSHPAMSRAGEERAELPDALGVLVPSPDPIRVLPAPPPRESDYVAWGVLIDEYQVRQVTLETLHVGPHLPREAKAVRLCAGLQPSVPDDRNGVFW